ncbi:MAG: acetylornithine/succinylornithine family transaminase [Gammaproteobacteria bacterium]|nr:acetylornithine/succinylornithine family transaminase [Gammaproteobacteria bacterium]
MPTYTRQSVAFKAGEGCWLIDEDGNRYLDALSGISVCNIGHANPHIGKEISQQASQLLHTSNLYRIPLQEKLASRLCTMSGLDTVFFCNSGAEANEAAIKICRKSANDRGMDDALIVVMRGSFHGRTMATLSATGNEKVQQGFAPLLQGFHHIPYNDLEALEALTTGSLNIIAVMLEPVQGEGGVVVPDKGYLQSVRKLCSEQDWLMVVDEVQTGMCRTGQWFACQHEQVVPDVMTIAKSLGNGVPIGACLANAEAGEVLSAGTHGSTFGGNPLSARAALAVIEYMSSNDIAKKATRLGERIRADFERNLGEVKEVRDIRNLGLMIGIQLDRDCADLVGLALDRKLLINVTAGNVIRLLPPLIMNDEELNLIVQTVSDLIKEYLKE